MAAKAKAAVVLTVLSAAACSCRGANPAGTALSQELRLAVALRQRGPGNEKEGAGTQRRGDLRSSLLTAGAAAFSAQGGGKRPLLAAGSFFGREPWKATRWGGDELQETSNEVPTSLKRRIGSSGAQARRLLGLKAALPFAGRPVRSSAPAAPHPASSAPLQRRVSAGASGFSTAPASRGLPHPQLPKGRTAQAALKEELDGSSSPPGLLVYDARLLPATRTSSIPSGILSRDVISMSFAALRLSPPYIRVAPSPAALDHNHLLQALPAATLIQPRLGDREEVAQEQDLVSRASYSDASSSLPRLSGALGPRGGLPGKKEQLLQLACDLGLATLSEGETVKSLKQKISEKLQLEASRLSVSPASPSGRSSSPAVMIGPRGGFPRKKEELLKLSAALGLATTGTISQLKGRIRERLAALKATNEDLIGLEEGPGSAADAEMTGGLGVAAGIAAAVAGILACALPWRPVRPPP